jgi:transcriptional regulator with XRE-family HTH domain
MEVKRKNSVLRKFGAAVRRYRRIAALTQEEFADMCDLDRSYVGGVERGERNLTLLNVIKICDTLKVNPSELFADLDKWPKRKRGELSDAAE